MNAKFVPNTKKRVKNIECFGAKYTFLQTFFTKYNEQLYCCIMYMVVLLTFLYYHFLI